MVTTLYFELLLFRSHRFRNVQVEVLYQRYFLRMNQNNMASLLGLLICISLVLIVVNYLPYTNLQPSLLQVRIIFILPSKLSTPGLSLGLRNDRFKCIHILKIDRFNSYDLDNFRGSIVPFPKINRFNGAC